MTAYERKDHSGTATTTVLTTGINSSDLAFTVDNGAGYPDGADGNPFVVTLDVGTSTEEKILCTSRTGDVFTVDPDGRGYDGTTAAAHAGATCTVIHSWSGVEADEVSETVHQTLGQIAAKGDLLSGNAANRLVKTAVGEDGLALVADSTQPGGVAWAEPAPASHDHSTGHGDPIPQSSVTGLGASLGAKLDLAGGDMTGALILAADAVDNLGAVTKQQLDAESLARGNADGLLLKLDGTVPMEGELILSGDAADPLGAVTKEQMDTADALHLPLAGGTMTGDLVLSDDTPDTAHSATSKAYVDTRDGKWALFTGTPDANGNVSIAHGLGVEPTGVFFTIFGPSTNASASLGSIQLRSVDATSILAHVYRPDGTLFSGSQVNFYWLALP